MPLTTATMLFKVAEIPIILCIYFGCVFKFNRWETFEWAWTPKDQAPALCLPQIFTDVFEGLVMLVMWASREPRQEANSKTNVHAADDVRVDELPK